MASFDRLITHNKRVSIILFIVMTLFFIVVGAVVGTYFAGSWQGGLVIAAIIGGVYGLIAWSQGDSIVLSMSGAREIAHSDQPQLWNVVEELSIAGGIPMPRVYLIEDTAMNAFATGRDPTRSSVAITRGLLEKCTRDELQGVMAHEMSHVRNYDIRFATLMAVMVGAIVLLCDVMRRSFLWGGGRRRSSDKGSGGGQALVALVAVVLSIVAPILATIIQLAVSRQREYLADAAAVELTRNPKGLISALNKLSYDIEPLESANRGTQHLFIVNPHKGKKLGRDSIFSTHPSLESRIARLEALSVPSRTAE